MTTIRGDRVRLRPATEGDVAAIVAMLAEPEVVRWWGVHDADRVRRELLEDAGCEAYAIESDEGFAGILVIGEETDPDYRHATIDLSLRSELHGRGLGRDALRAAVEHLARERGHHRFTIDPAAENERAIRCYSAVGFRPVGVMRRHWRDPDGGWRDGLLMELLAEDL